MVSMLSQTFIAVLALVLLAQASAFTSTSTRNSMPTSRLFAGNGKPVEVTWEGKGVVQAEQGELISDVAKRAKVAQ
jgi:hypothetical protein